MSVKEKTLEVLENNRGSYISGAELAGMLKVSRNAVWKAIKSLEKEGYIIDAVKNRGYRLADTNDILSEQSIQKYIKEHQDVFKIQVYKCLRSTNETLKELAFNGGEEGIVVIAEEQTCGRGQLGRSFYSPMGTGIYMSLLLRPKMNLEDALFLTTSAAVAVSQAIEYVSHRKAQIKWVNDVYCDGKKVCGILTEASLNVEAGGIDYIVLGIGINVNKPEEGFPDDITRIADSIFDNTKTNVRSQLIAEVLMRFWNYYEHLEEKKFLEEYINRSCLIGKKVLIERKEGEEEVEVMAINEQCHLIVKHADGKEEEIYAGTVRLRTLNN